MTDRTPPPCIVHGCQDSGEKVFTDTRTLPHHQYWACALHEQVLPEYTWHLEDGVIYLDQDAPLDVVDWDFETTGGDNVRIRLGLGRAGVRERDEVIRIRCDDLGEMARRGAHGWDVTRKAAPPSP